MTLENIHLVLFLSRATSLCRWKKLGILERELTIYQQLSPKLKTISFLTSGGEDELLLQIALQNISLLYNRAKISPNIYSFIAPFIHRQALSKADIFQTNQLDGAWTAIIAGALLSKPVIVRAGYLWSEFYRKAGGKGFKAWLIEQLQSFSFKNANLIIVTTELMRGEVIDKYKISPDTVKVIPNYVDTNLFHQQSSIQPIPGRLCYIGRLHPNKNLENLIKAMEGLPDLSLIIIGEGEQRQKLENLVKSLNVNATFMGVIDQSKIPIEINRSQIFILPSLIEGHSKALIEAMACGIPVIGADVKGIHEEIVHGDNGWLCSIDSSSIRNAILYILNDIDLQRRLRQNSRKYILKKYAVERVVELELSALQDVCKDYESLRKKSQT